MKLSRHKVRIHIEGTVSQMFRLFLCIRGTLGVGMGSMQTILITTPT